MSIYFYNVSSFQDFACYLGSNNTWNSQLTCNDSRMRTNSSFVCYDSGCFLGKLYHHWRRHSCDQNISLLKRITIFLELEHIVDCYYFYFSRCVSWLRTSTNNISIQHRWCITILKKFFCLFSIHIFKAFIISLGFVRHNAIVSLLYLLNRQGLSCRQKLINISKII